MDVAEINIFHGANRLVDLVVAGERTDPKWMKKHLLVLKNDPDINLSVCNLIASLVASEAEVHMYTPENQPYDHSYEIDLSTSNLSISTRDYDKYKTDQVTEVFNGPVQDYKSKQKKQAKKKTMNKQTMKMQGHTAILDSSKLNLDLGNIPVTIIGYASTELPVAGRIAIIHAPQLNCKEYPWDCVSVPEVFLSK